MKLVLDKLFGDFGITSQELKAQGEHLGAFYSRFLGRDQGFVHLPRLKAQVLAVKALAQDFKGKHKNIVVLGIGGSALGISCLRDALKGPYWNQHGSPRLFVLDNLDLVDEVMKVVNLDETLFLVISKSGTTPETMAQYFYFRSKVKRDQFIFITDPEKGVLKQLAKEEGIPTLDIPSNVGGRFSVLSPVGLLAAELLDIDIEALLEGAQEMADSFSQREFDLNLPFQLASALYLLEWKQGIHMTVLLPYSTFLATFADWSAQLIAESLGKEGKGLTPIKALGATDQHSQLQLYNEGPNDKVVIFIEIEKDQSSVVPSVGVKELSYLGGVSFQKLMNTERAATEEALSEYKKPSLNIQIPELNAFTLGQLFMLFQAAVAFLGEFYSINAYNQPGVELGKVLTKNFLQDASDFS